MCVDWSSYGVLVIWHHQFLERHKNDGHKDTESTGVLLEVLLAACNSYFNTLFNYNAVCPVWTISIWKLYIPNRDSNFGMVDSIDICCNYSVNSNIPHWFYSWQRIGSYNVASSLMWMGTSKWKSKINMARCSQSKEMSMFNDKKITKTDLTLISDCKISFLNQLVHWCKRLIDKCN